MPEKVLFTWFGFYGISTIVGYLMPNPVYAYILNIYDLLVGFCGTSTIVGYLMPNPIYIYFKLKKKKNLWFVNTFCW